MEVILKQDCKGIGWKNDIIKVKPGYGRNYLILQDLAMVANEVNRKVTAENIRQSTHKLAKQREQAEALKERLAALTIKIKVNTSENGKIFGSVTPIHLEEALKHHNLSVASKDIRFSKPVKELGTHEATISLHEDIVHTLVFSVVSK
mmetsp:Transcript_9666/g.22204  ORF Transcript_9666/g.22204 Transcript_9666/m.22204 type:complete len:148 (-) Transcript_9666:2452-2895(-)